MKIYVKKHADWNYQKIPTKPEKKKKKKKNYSSWTNSFSDPKGEVPNLKGSLKNRADKILIWPAMNSRQTADGRRQTADGRRQTADGRKRAKKNILF
jgi:hypothetical protein